MSFLLFRYKNRAKTALQDTKSEFSKCYQWFETPHSLVVICFLEIIIGICPCACIHYIDNKSSKFKLRLPRILSSCRLGCRKCTYGPWTSQSTSWRVHTKFAHFPQMMTSLCGSLYNREKKVKQCIDHMCQTPDPWTKCARWELSIIWQ